MSITVFLRTSMFSRPAVKNDSQAKQVVTIDGGIDRSLDEVVEQIPGATDETSEAHGNDNNVS